MSYSTLNKDKSIASLLYIIKTLGGKWDMYSVLKILYFAERSHLFEYGRTITGDAMIAMENGPVPSFSYDEVKIRTIDKNFFDTDEENIIVATKEPNIDTLSESEIECLDASIEDNKHLGFGDLKKKSHGSAYNLARQRGINSSMSFIDLAKEGVEKEGMIDYIRENLQFNYWR